MADKYSFLSKMDLAKIPVYKFRTEEEARKRDCQIVVHSSINLNQQVHVLSKKLLNDKVHIMDNSVRTYV